MRPDAVAQDPVAMPRDCPVRLLVVEDNPLDYELLLHQLVRDGFAPHAFRVEDEQGLRAALAAGGWDAVVSDHHLPRFSSEQALAIVRDSGSNLPFLIVSGTIGEDAAVAAMRAGADDFLIKGRLARLGPALRNAIAAARAGTPAARSVRALTRHLQQVVEAERSAIAREIHDDIGGMLTALRFDLSWLERHGDPQSLPRVRQAMETLNQAVLAAQRVMRNLRPPALDAGIVAALDFLAAQFRERSGVATIFNSNRDRIDVPESVAITVYRVAQETLTNVMKHAQATEARLDLMLRDDVLSLEVSDNGRGIAPADLNKPASFGLRGLRERARQVDGWIEIAAGSGRTAVMLTIPLTESAAALIDAGAAS